MHRLATPVGCLACSLLLAACPLTQDAPPTVDSAQHVRIASIPLESPRGITGLVLAADDRSRRLLVGMPGADRVLVVSYSDHKVERVIDHPPAAMKFGSAVAWVGDLDSDGQADIAVGAPGMGPPEGTGRVLLYSSANGALLRELAQIAPGDAFGSSLAARGTTLVVGCPQLGEGGYARFDLGAGGAPVVQRCAGSGGRCEQLMLAEDPETRQTLLLTLDTRGIECRRLETDEHLWSYEDPTGWPHLAQGNHPGEFVFATRSVVNSLTTGDEPSTIGLLTSPRGQCHFLAAPGGVDLVAYGSDLIVLDEQGGLEAFAWKPRSRAWIARPDRGINPYWSSLCTLDERAGHRVVAWAAAYTEPRASIVGELRLYAHP